MRKEALKASISNPPNEAPEEKILGVKIKSKFLVVEEGTIPFGESGMSIGEMLDRQLKQLAMHDGQMMEHSISFDPESWEAAKAFYKDWEPQPYY
jgi:hypothetical protein